ncbi:MAG: ribose-phosphate pyrophosphokinase [Spirochaetaceae bacterium]|nr:MAG: ribose-phosphate pyrophosphokinase [Spirochaetaceae bacterium]
MRGDLLILSTRSMDEYTARVAYHMETFPEFHSVNQSAEFVGKLRTVKFADGEMEVEVNSSLRGKDVYLFSSAGRNGKGLSVEENKLELYHTVDALRRAAAGRITLFEPYCSSSRSDRTTRRNSVGFWVHYKTLMSLGVNHILTYSLHSDKSRTVVDPTLCAIEDIPATVLLKEYITDTFIKSIETLESDVQKRWIFCSVDAGGEGVAKRFARAFGADLVIAHKQRNYREANTIESINILSDTEIEGKEIWIVDDMIDTAGSVDALVRELTRRGVGSINIAAVHPVFSDPAVERLVALHEDGWLKRVVVVDSVHCSDALKSRMPFLHVVSSAKLSAEVVMRMHEDGSLSPFFDPFDARKYLSSMKLFV